MSDGHLFPPDDPQLTLQPQPRAPEKKRHLKVVRPPERDPRVRLLTDDGAGQGEAEDGLPARVVAPHSAKKAWMVGRYLDTVGRAMARKWFKINYVELFCGPGILLDRHGDEQPGSPLQAVAIDRPFERYVFCDGSPDCVAAVSRRIVVPSSSRVDVFCGDANEREHLERVAALLNPRALVIVYLDPAKPNLDFSTVRFFAERFQQVDLIINLPFANINRSLAVESTEWPARFLNHPDPMQLRHSNEFHASQGIREHYLGELRKLGLKNIEREEVRTSKAPLYDIVLASRKDTASTLWQKANRVKHDGQIGLDLPPAP
jgi:three-Cys-motif partner protein